MFILYANKNKLTVQSREPVTSGSVNVYPIRVEFSEDWDGLTRIAVFKSGEEMWSVPLDGDGQCIIPWEALTVPNRQLSVGVYGAGGSGTVLPTVWTSLGTILEGVPAPEESARPPAPDWWEQELSKKGDALGYTEDGDLGLFAGSKLLSSVPIAGGGGSGPAYGVGHGLKIVNGNLTVNSVDDFKGDNTLPMTASGVQTVVGNIETLLGTI